MKKFISIILVLSLLAVFSVNVFAEKREINSFETLFVGSLPTYLYDTTEFEAGKEYVIYVSTPRNQEHFEADGGAFEGVRGTIVREDILCANAEIITIEEDDNFNYIITFMPTNQGEFSIQFTMRVFGFDIIGDDYRTILGDEWTYTFVTDPMTVTPSSNPTYTPGATTNTSSNNNTASATTSNVQNTSSATDVDVDNGEKSGPSIWIWVAVAVAVVVCGVVVVVMSKKKLAK